jgi:crotonobetainyl-CoA:carnitine CoA-transferase CaiB-like acyl-CoA transferase
VTREDPAAFRIVDFSTHLSGPLATHLLTELGATVVKIENPRTGDGNRLDGELIHGVGVMHLALNSGARSLAIDRHSEEWPEIVAAAARWADAVVVGARPVDARRRGMDFETMRRANPRLIYCSLSGFGEHGPWRDYTAHGQTIDTWAGLVPVEPGDPHPTTRSGWRTAGTTLGGVFAAMGVLAALRRRDNGLDDAQYVAVSLWQAAMWWSWRDLTTLANLGTRWLDYSDLGSRYGLYTTSDDRVVLVAPLERRFWERFCDIVGLPEELKSVGEWGATGMVHGEGPEFDCERVLIAERIRGHPLAHWVPLFEADEIPFAPVLTVQEAMDSEHARVNGVLRETEVGGRALQIPAIPVRFGAGESIGGQLPPLSPPPGLGEHRDEILAELGIAAAPERSAR